jgi:hypothetical protein
MKKSFYISVVLCLIYQIGFSQKVGREKKDDHDMQGMYIDLNTTNLVNLCYDTIHHKTINVTGAGEVYFFINPETGDTIYGRGIYIVNGLVIRGKDNTYRLNPGLVMNENGQLKIRGNGTCIKNSAALIRNLNCNLKEPAKNNQFQSRNQITRDIQNEKNIEGKMKAESAKN